MSAGDHELLQAVLALFHHQEECIPPLPNVQSGTGTDQEGNQLSMEVNNTTTKYTPFKFLKCFSMSLGKRVKKSGGLILSKRLLIHLTCKLFIQSLSNQYFLYCKQ